jgi:glutamate synthase domain-containing protein 2
MGWLPPLLSARLIVYTSVVLITAILLAALLFWSHSIFLAIPLIAFAALAALGTYDLIQSRHAVLRNYPLTAHIRFILEEIRPEIRQYFLESEKDGTPFSRDKRAIVYQRAKRALDKRPFGTQNDVYASGYVIRSRRSTRSRSNSASSSAGPIAPSRIRRRSSTFRR